MRKGVKSAVKIEINLSLDEFKRLLANGAGFKDLLATNIKEPVTKTVEKDGGSKSDEPLVEKPEPQGRGHHGDSPGQACGANAKRQTT
jgi:hypothetical protein